MNRRLIGPRPDAAPDRQTGRLLEEWLRDEAPAHEPPVLVPTVLARIALTRRRPAWLIRDWWRWRPGRSKKGFPKMNTATQLAAVTVLALSGVGLLLVAGVRPDGEQAVPPASAELDPSEVVSSFTGETPGFSVVDYGEQEMLPDKELVRGYRFEGDFEVSDTRLSGTLWSVHNFDSWRDFLLGHVVTGTVGIENEDGSWLGTFQGYETPGTVTEEWHYWVVLKGSDEYEGLTAIWSMLPDGSKWVIDGMIFPGKLPPYPDMP